MSAAAFSELCWPTSKLGDCITALARKTGLTGSPAGVSNLPGEASIEWYAKRLGCEAESVETTFAELEHRLGASHPALIQLDEDSILAVIHSKPRRLRVLAPDSTIKDISLRDVCNILREAVEQPTRPQYERLLSETEIPPVNQAKVLNSLLAEQIGARRFDRYWVLRISPGARPGRWLRQAGAMQKTSGLVAAHSAQYLLWLGAWAILGRISFEGRLNRKWLLVWGLLLLAGVPLRVLTTWLQGRLAIGVGRILKRRLLGGSLRLEPDEVRHQGVGSFLGQALEAEAVETLALSGGIAGVLALIEIIVAAFVLQGFAALLFVWTVLTAAVGWRFIRRYQRWTTERMRVTHQLIESMVGHRTRLAQQRREEWHDTEDETLNAYFRASRAADGTATVLISLIPRGWLLIGIAALAPYIVDGDISQTRIVVVLGGVLLAYNAFRRLTASFADIAAAWIAWQRIAPLFHAAARPEHLPAPIQESDGKDAGLSPNVIQADGLTYRYRKHGRPVLQSGSLIVRRGDRVLLEGSSGGGKSTFASLLAGLRKPESGVLLLNGHNREILGDELWRKRVVAAPQFHENHILTETLAFNLLMGRGWPPSVRDIEQAESLCRELGLGDLLERMPAGILQMVGEGGWQLSHGERSRVYIARALLQNADLVILDESFAALDPENLKTALECTLQRAGTLLVIAHP